MKRANIIRSVLDFLFTFLIYYGVYLLYFKVFRIELGFSLNISNLNVAPYIVIALIWIIIEALLGYFFWNNTKFIELYLKINPEDQKAKNKLAELLMLRVKRIYSEIDSLDDRTQEKIKIGNQLLEKVKNTKDLEEAERLSADGNNLLEEAQILVNKSKLKIKETTKLTDRASELLGEEVDIKPTNSKLDETTNLKIQNEQ